MCTRNETCKTGVAAHTNSKVSHTLMKTNIWWTQLNTWADADTREKKKETNKHNKRCEPTHPPVDACGKFLKFCELPHKEKSRKRDRKREKERGRKREGRKRERERERKKVRERVRERER